MSTDPHDLNRLAALIDGRLEQDERRAVEEHLTRCESCRSTLSTWGQAQAERPGRSRPALPVWLGTAAAAALAAWVASRVSSTRPAPVPRLPEAVPTAASASSSETAPPPAPAVSPEPPDVKRGGETRVGGKTFRLVAGEWVDGAFDATAGLPAVEASGPEERRALLRRQPGLAPYARLGDRVTVVLAGTVYRFLPRPH